MSGEMNLTHSMRALFGAGSVVWVQTPARGVAIGSPYASGATSHGA